MEKCRLLGVSFRNEMDSLLHDRDCPIKISNVTKMLEPKHKAAPEVTEMATLVRVLVWHTTERPLLSRNRFIQSNEVTEAFRPTLQKGSKTVQSLGRIRVTIRGETHGLLRHCDGFIDIGMVVQTLKSTVEGYS